MPVLVPKAWLRRHNLSVSSVHTDRAGCRLPFKKLGRYFHFISELYKSPLESDRTNHYTFRGIVTDDY